MREILFRGKRIDNGEWAYGSLIEQNNPEYHTYIVRSFLAEIDKENIDVTNLDIVEVDPNTVGQYTELKDKDGAKIFEGDILAFDDMDGSKGIYEVFWDGNNGKFAIAASGNRNYVDDFELFDELFERNEYFKLFEVIGNINDNPELLKE